MNQLRDKPTKLIRKEHDTDLSKARVVIHHPDEHIIPYSSSTESQPSTSQLIAQAVPKSEPKSVAISRSVGVTARPNYRSKAIQVQTKMCDQFCSPIKFKQTKGLLIINPPQKTKRQLFFNEGNVTPQKLIMSSDFSSPTSQSSQIFLQPSSKSGSNDFSDDPESAAQLSKKLTIRSIHLTPRRYIGIPKHGLWVIKIIEKYSVN